MPSYNDVVNNQLEIKNFELQIDRLPGVSYHCISAPLPGVASVAAPVFNPFTTIKEPGDHLTFTPLIVTFIVDENMKNWDEIFFWMQSYGHPDNFTQYSGEVPSPPKQIVDSKKSDGSLILTNNKYNYSRTFTFEDMFPVDLSEVMFDTQVEDVFVATCTASFEFTQFYPKL